MKVIAAPVAEGWHLALIVAVVPKMTRMGEIPFLRCRITTGKNKGRQIDYLIPSPDFSRKGLKRAVSVA
jgi:ribosomal protein S28E/S33